MLEGDGLAPVTIVDAPEYLEADDLLELVHAGAIPATVVDSYLADFWGQVYTNVLFHRDVPVVRDRQIGWALRKNMPQLMGHVEAFVKEHKAGTLYGNILINRYLKDAKRLQNPRGEADQKRFEKAWPLFQKYGEMYNFDPIFLTAVAYQESRLEQNTQSRAGAVGIMQIKPSTAADPNVGIHDISTMENNIHAGTKYLAFLRERYFSGEEIDSFNRYYLTLAAYNAGPGNIRKMRGRAPSMGLDPNRWFGDVEVVTARHVGREPVTYVSNIAKYYYAFQLSAAQLELKKQGE
jgi:membrane-bound lytic murein transglycosylase MltF